MTNSLFTSENANKLAAMVIGNMAMGKANIYTRYNVRGIHFIIEIAPLAKTGKNRYMVDADYSDFPRDEKASNLLHDEIYQSACRFFHQVNGNLAKYLF